MAGENGAGKSTLVNILSGVISASEYSGELRIGGSRRHLRTIRDAEQSGVFLVPQELNIVPQLSVGEYLFLNREPQRFGLLDTRKLWRDTAHWLETFQLAVSPLTLMEELSVYEQQLVAITRAMTQGVRVLILDEPTASLTERETELLFSRIAELRARGVTTIYISHRLAEFERIADVVTVMRDGRVVDNFPLAGGVEIPRRVIRAMVGRDLNEMYPKHPAPIGSVLFETRNWTVESRVPGRPPAVKNVSFHLSGGEVLGIFGLVGSGTSDLARSIFGVHMGRSTGKRLLRGKEIHYADPREALKSGIVYLPADRKRDGLIPGMSVAENMSLAALGLFATWVGVVDRSTELAAVQQYVSSLHVKCDSADQNVMQLSGGNQQKVVAAKWLLANPDILVFEEPTRGVDVNARIDLYNLINDVTASGKSVILLSTDLPEVLGMADRILVMCDGAIAAEWQRGEASEETVMLYAAGGHA